MTASTGLVEIPWKIAEREIVENPDFGFREAFYLVEINKQREIIYMNDSGISWIRDNGIFANPNVNIKFVCKIDPEEIYKREIVREKMKLQKIIDFLHVVFVVCMVVLGAYVGGRSLITLYRAGLPQKCVCIVEEHK